MSALLSVSNLEFVRGGETLFSDVAFTVHAGERVALLGNNGAGKSTLLAALAGVLPVGGRGRHAPGLLGDIVHEGRPLQTLSLTDRVSAFAWLPQALWRDPHFDVGAFLALGSGQRKRDDARRIRRLFDVDVLLRRRLDALSGGEWRRVQLTKAFETEAKLLLLDEPNAGLDLRHSGALRAAMVAHTGAAECCQGSTGPGPHRPAGGVVFSTHDLALVAACATHVGVLERGRVPFWGSFEAFREGDVASRLFGVRVRWHQSTEGDRVRWFPEVVT